MLCLVQWFSAIGQRQPNLPHFSECVYDSAVLESSEVISFVIFVGLNHLVILHSTPSAGVTNIVIPRGKQKALKLLRRRSDWKLSPSMPGIVTVPRKKHMSYTHLPTNQPSLDIVPSCRLFRTSFPIQSQFVSKIRKTLNPLPTSMYQYVSFPLGSKDH